MKQRKTFRLAHGGRKPVLSLAEADAQGLVEPGSVVRLVTGPLNEGRPDPATAHISEVYIEDVDPMGPTITLAASDPGQVATGDKVKMAFGAPSGLYVGSGILLEAEPMGDQHRLVVSLPTLRWVEERTHSRVRIPGARATCRNDYRVFDCPIHDISCDGMRVEVLDDIAPGTDLTVRLAVPLLPPADIAGQVIWHETFPGGSAHAGIKFTQMPEACRERLSNICALFRALFN